MAALWSRLLAFIMSILALFGIGTQHKPPEVKADDYAYRIEENEIELSLSANSSTGYSWTCEPDSDALAVVGSDYSTVPGNPLIPGSPGTQYFTLRAMAPGTVNVHLVYARHWEGGDTAKDFVIVIDISPSLEITVR